MMRTKKSIPLKLYQKQAGKVGQSPGTLSAFGEKPQTPTGITVIDYDSNKSHEKQIETLSELRPLKDSSTNSWINVEGITDTNLVAEIGQLFDIHPLVLEDIVNPRQRIKCEVYDNYIFKDTITSFRELAADMLDGYLSMISYKMNEVMQVLTIFAAIFIPLTFIAGVYGMNFEFMPELQFKYMYLIVWVLMIGTAGAMLVYFKRKKWF